VLIERGSAVFMARRRGALLDGLWEPPGVELAGSGSAGPRLRGVLAKLGVRAKIERTDRRVRHTITHRAIVVEVWKGRLVSAGPRSADARFVDPCRPKLPLTALATKLTRDSLRSE
jgi:hypothetical protein